LSKTEKNNSNLPRHIAIIPDGNRRWAKKRKMPVFFGHREGGKTAQKTIQTAFDLGIPCLTFWGCSLGNITKRPTAEVKFLYKIFETNFKTLAKEKRINADGVKINILGRWREYFPENLKQILEDLIKKTEKNTNFNLNFMMAYSGIDEMTEAVKHIAKSVTIDKELKIDDDLIKKNLWTKDLPPVDLVIRTGGEPHWSAGFMMWDVADAQFYFTETLWPAFSKKEFEKAVFDYSDKERRLGK
jgi:undecaprenyl diphosphate synthase